MRNPARRNDIDRTKGLAILLVVFGHLVARQTPDHSMWSRAYDQARVAVYLCHMPVFFYLSGLVVMLSGTALTPPGRMVRFARSRAARLLVPFLIFGVLTVVGKAAMRGVTPVDNAPRSLASGMEALVWNTVASPALSVWYLAVLFALAVATPPLLRLVRGRAAWLLPPALLLYVLPLPPVLYADRLHLYALFYLLGLIAGQSTSWLGALDRYWAVAAVALASLLAAITTGVIPDIGMIGMPYDAYLLAAGVLAIPAIHGLCRNACPAPGALLWLGQNCFTIYLGNTIAIGLAKAAIMRTVPWTGETLPIFLPLLMLAGIALPLMARDALALPALTPARGVRHSGR